MVYNTARWFAKLLISLLIFFYEEIKNDFSAILGTPSTPKSKYHVDDNMLATPRSHYIPDDDLDSSPYSLSFSQRAMGVEVITWGN